MQDVGFASLTARETAPDPRSSECGDDMGLYMRDCRRLIDLGLKRWGGDAPGLLGPRVLNPVVPYDLATIKRMFNPQPPLQPIAHTEATDDEGGAGPLLQLQDAEMIDAEPDEEPAPQLQLQQSALMPVRLAPPPDPQPPSQQPPTSVLQSERAAPEATAPAGSSTDAPQPVEVEAPAPTATEAPPMLVPPSALQGLSLSQLVSQLGGVLAAKPRDDAVAEQLLGRLEGLKLEGQEMQDAGPLPTAHVPGVPRTCTAPRLRCSVTESSSHGPAQARASSSTVCARSQERLRHLQHAPSNCTLDGRLDGGAL
tara:strand:- start:826 stop:1758 length:933 start_codon:yes stop_codon:yes gene_type:complete